jgi:hypothetical protein
VFVKGDIFSQFFEFFSRAGVSIKDPALAALEDVTVSCARRLAPICPPAFVKKIAHFTDVMARNSNETAIPFLNAAIKMLKFCENGELVVNFALSALVLDVPQVILDLLDLIEFKQVRNDLAREKLLPDVLMAIGKCLTEERQQSSEVSGQGFDLGAVHGFSCALVLRTLIAGLPIEHLLKLFGQSAQIDVGLLVVLSVRFLDPFRGQKVKWNDEVHRCRSIQISE